MSTPASQSASQSASRPAYVARSRVRHITRPDFQLTEIHLADKQEIPWHVHSSASDTFYVLDGSIRIELASPSERIELSAGAVFQVQARRAHRVSSANGEPCAFLVLQGIGDCDFVPAPQAAS